MDHEAREGEFSDFAIHEYINLITFRPDSSAAHNTVRFVVIGNYLYIESSRSSGQVRRIEATGRVLVVPSSHDGAPLGRTRLGLGRTVEGREADEAKEALRAKYGQAHDEGMAAMAGDEQEWETIEIRAWDE